MRSSIFRYALLLAVALASVCPVASGGVVIDTIPKTRDEKQIERYTNRWNRAIPRYAKMQYAGGMGMLSFGVGWDYGKKKQWETDFFIGFVPKFSSDRATAVFTLKQNYIPWKIKLCDYVFFEPLETGVYFTAVTSRDFWSQEPEKYGGSYYKFPTSFRANIFLGQRFVFGGWKRRPHQSLSVYYEVSSNDLYLMSAFTNKALRPRDYLVMSVGAKFHFGVQRPKNPRRD